MAEPIKQIRFQEPDPAKKREQDLLEVEEALLENKDAILEIMDIVGYLKQRGILDLAKGALGQGDKVLDVAVNTLNMPENKNTIKNLLLLAGTMGMINVTQLEPLLLKVNAGIAKVAENEHKEPQKTGYFTMARALKDPEVNRSVTLLLDFLKGMGASTEELERNEPAPAKPNVSSGKTQEPKRS